MFILIYAPTPYCEGRTEVHDHPPHREACARLKTYIIGHLDFHASQRWPQLEEITITWRGSYGYVTGHLPSDGQLPLCRLRYLGSDTDWGFAKTTTTALVNLLADEGFWDSLGVGMG